MEDFRKIELQWVTFYYNLTVPFRYSLLLINPRTWWLKSLYYFLFGTYRV
jgi:hypothetical protein